MYCPTPTEIDEACEEIRSGWTEEERQRRLLQYAEDIPLEVLKFARLGLERVDD
jgi:hypothetical protein